jgi:parallel beta-helix repeat protein
MSLLGRLLAVVLAIAALGSVVRFLKRTVASPTPAIPVDAAAAAIARPPASSSSPDAGAAHVADATADGVPAFARPAVGRSSRLNRARARRAAAVLSVTLVIVPLASTLADSGNHGPKEQPARASQKIVGGGNGNSNKSQSNAGRTPTPTPTPVQTTPTPTATTSQVTTKTPAPSPTLPPSGYSVATWGSDTNAGTLTSPWRTLQKAANAVPAGGTVYIRGGTYGGFTMTRSGTTSAEITFTEYPGEVAVISGSGGPAKVVQLSAVHDVTISSLTVQGAPSQYGAGIYVENGSHDITVQGNTLQENRSFGVKVLGSSNVAIKFNSIRRNETGIEISGGGSGVVIAGNSISANDRMIVNDATAWNDRGANAISFYRTTGPITVSQNTIYGNRAASHDYGFDGGAFEIYAASGLTITNNVMWDNENVLETGTDGTDCANNTFTRNVAFKGPTTSVAGPSMGLILRCAENMLVANNTLHRLDKFAFDVSLAGGFASSIDGLRIMNNVAMGPDHPYSLDTAIPLTVTIDYNDIYNPIGGAIAYVYSHGNTNSLSEFRSWTGFDRNGIQANPLFVDVANADFHLKDTSPAIDRATPVTGITTGFLGLAPDMGRYETK